jgi:hypothetical protein
MSDPAFTRPDLFSIPVAKQTELAAAVRGLLNADGYPSVGDNPLAPRDVANTLVETASRSGPGGIGISCTHNLLPSWDLRVTCSHTCQLMNAVPGTGRRTFRYLDRQSNTGGACLLTGHRGRRTEAGR